MKTIEKNTIKLACISDAWDTTEKIRRIKAGAHLYKIDISSFLNELTFNCSVKKLNNLIKKHKINIY